MADPLSVASSIAGLVSLAGVVLAKTYEYASSVNDASNEIEMLRNEIAGLSGVLIGLQASGCLEATEFPPSYESAVGKGSERNVNNNMDLRKHAEVCADTLRRLLDKLKKYDSEGRKGRGFRRLFWPFEKAEMIEILETLEREKTLFTLALSNNMATGIQKLQDEVKVLRLEQQESFSQIKSSQSRSQQREVYKWLSNVDYSALHKRAADLRHPNTGNGVLSSDSLSNWRARECGFLWIYGIPGCGKTVMISSIIDHILLPLLQRGEIGAYFYCDFRVEDTRKPSKVLGSLLSQLCSQLNETPQLLQDIYSRSRLSNGISSEPSIIDLKAVFKEVVKSAKSQGAIVNIIVDALDECFAGADRTALMELLLELGAPGNCRVLVSSRPEAEIRNLYGNMDNVSLESSLMTSDINIYIRSEMQNKRFSKMKPQLREEVIQKLSTEAKGMFRWATCQLDMLAKTRTDKALRSVLGSLPQGLYETYLRILNDIDEADRVLAKRALRWLAYSTRLMTLEELAEAVIIQIGDTTLDEEARLSDANDVLEICGSLISLDSKRKTLSLSHYSVKEFLCSQYLEQQNTRLSRFYLGGHQNDGILAKVCLTYILLEGVMDKPVTENYPFALNEKHKSFPFLDYAVRCWPRFAKPRGFISSDSKAKEMVEKLFHSGKCPRFLAWVQLLLGVENPIGIPFFATPLYYAASFGLYDIVESLLKEGANIDEPGGLYGGTPLHAAVYRRHIDVTRLLVEHGAQSIRDNNGQTPIDFAYLWWNRSEGVDKMIEILKRPRQGSELTQSVTARQTVWDEAWMEQRTRADMYWVNYFKGIRKDRTEREE